MASTDFRDPLNKQIIDEAAEWFVEFSTDEPDARMRRDFDAWLRLSPQHLRAYLEMFPLWEDAPFIDADRTVSAEDLIALARRADGNVVALVSRPGGAPDAHDATPQRRRRVAPRVAYAVAASFLFAAVGLTSWLYLQHGIYATGIGEQHVITLADGSDIELNARSKIRVDFDDTQRRVELLAGQALFHVAKNTHRPFIVESGQTQVRAVGTQFDVNRKRSGTVITVVEGRVAVQSTESAPAERRAMDADIVANREIPPKSKQSDTVIGAAPLQTAAEEILLAAGEQLTITSTALARPAQADIASATAWRQRRLVFSSTPLPEVADEFNRYNERQLIVLGPALDTFNISAVFSATDIPSLLRFLRAQPGITIDERGRDIRISSNPSNPR